MDPFSLLTGAVGLVAICTQLVLSLRDIHAAAATVDQEVEALSGDVENVKSVVEIIYAALKKRADREPNGPQETTAKSWHNATKTLAGVIRGCEDKLTKLSLLVRDIKGGERSGLLGKFDDFRKQLRKLSKDEDYRRLRAELTNSLVTLQLMLNTIQLLDVQDSSSPSGEQLSESIRRLNDRLDNIPMQLESSEETFNAAQKSAQDALLLATANKHFEIPHSVSSLYIGREAQLEELGQTFLGPEPAIGTRVQKRFVIYGIGGAGKTEFCCKFAQNYRKHFWGVFHIDASMDGRAKHGYSKLAKQFAGREPNDKAAKNWLSNLQLSWLLIIDNADDPNVRLEALFPEGERGHILITTRNPAFKVHGTVGKRSFRFDKLESEPAADLLLQAAAKSQPWDKPTKTLAREITTVLGCLPLALVCAGKAIRVGLCTLHDYIRYYRSSFERIGRALRASGNPLDQDDFLTVYSTYELNYLALKDRKGEAAADALQLLNMFAFLNNENVRWDLLTRAANGPIIEKNSKKGALASNQSVVWNAITLGAKLRAKGMEVLEYLVSDRGLSVLPDALRISEAGIFDEFRVRKALTELTQHSLITYHADSDCYSCHAIIHDWLRERPEMMRDVSDPSRMTLCQPEMRTGRQALWCQAAATTLAQSILLPPLGTQVADEDFRRDLLPHVEHVRKQQARIVKQHHTNRQLNRFGAFWAVRPKFSRSDAVQLAKYSFVYAQAGLWKEAEELQTRVRDFVCAARDLDHPDAVRIQLALAQTYWLRGKYDDAAKLQEQVLNACKNTPGVERERILAIMITLASTYSAQGRNKEGLEILSDSAVDEYSGLLGTDHDEVLRAYDMLGRLHQRYFRWQEAKILHTKALEGMRRSKTIGPTHRDTLLILENLAMTDLMLRDSLLAGAQEMMDEVIKVRKERLGPENPFTLIAIANRARIKCARGLYKESEADLRPAIKIVMRNYGANYIGTLYGRARLGHTLACDQRWEEAESELCDTIEKYAGMHEARNGHHPDRLMAMYYLLHCYRLQDRIDEARAICPKLLEGMRAIGGHEHPLMRHFVQTQEALEDSSKVTDVLRREWIVMCR
ncbi:hypothetical protein MMC26_002824 [Xylographa opegraphella]|nr:hypothetical protein [Xylographa opegraphella]